MHDKLLSRIDSVTRRLRAIWRWRLAAVVATIAVLAGIAMLWYTASNQQSGYEPAIALLTGVIFLFIIALVIVQFSFRDPRQVASKIEQRFPSLDQRLLTALSQDNADQQKLRYLQQRVMTEVEDHARFHRWIDVVPSGQLLWSRISGIAATVILAVVLGLLVISEPTREIQAIASQSKIRLECRH